MESIDDKLKVHKQQKKRIVIYLENSLLRKLSTDTRNKVLNTVSGLKCKVYNENNADDILKYKNLVVVRYGAMPHRIESRLPLKNSVIVSGEF